MNRNGKFQTVARLYAKYELPYAYNSNHRYYEKVKQQYMYAYENLESIRRAAGGESAESGTDAEGIRQAIISRLISFAKNLLYLGCAFFIFTLLVSLSAISFSKSDNGGVWSNEAY